MLPNSGSAAHSQKPVILEASVNGKERWFNQKSWKCGEKVDSRPETNSKDSAQTGLFLKGKRCSGGVVESH